MHRRQAQQVLSALVQLAQGHMHANIEQQEHHAKFSQQVSRAALLDQAEHAGPDQDAGNQVSHNRAEAHGF